MKKVLKNYFVPHEENDHKPHILREVSLVTMLATALILCVTSLGSNYLVTSTSLLGNVYSSVLVDLTNADRIKNNKPVLTISPVLENAAQMKANDMVTKNYFAHTSPDGLTPWHWFKKAGYSFSYAGENLAVGFSESEQVNNGWLNSPTHKANIIDEHFTEIGIATMNGTRKGKDATYVVQMFGKPKVVPKKKTPTTLTTTITPSSEAIRISGAGQTASVLSAQASDAEQDDVVYVSEVYNDPQFAVAHNTDSSLIDESTPRTQNEQSTAPQYSTRFERFIANQPMMVSYVLMIFMILISFGLLVFLIHEVRIKHYKHFLFGLLVFIVLFGLWIVNHSFILFDRFV